MVSLNYKSLLKKPLESVHRVCFYCQNAHKQPQQSTSSPSQYFRPFGRIRNYAMSKFFGFVQGYENIMEKNFPKAFKIYQVFSIGIKDFYRDFKLFIVINMEQRRGKKFRDLTLQEIEICHSMPREIRRVAPTLLLSSLPFANYVIFPLAYAFPKRLLSSHFWSIQQKNEFSLQDHKLKLHYYRPVFRHLQAKLSTIAEPKLRDNCNEMFHKLGSGTHPTIPEIMAVKTAFTNAPYALRFLTFGHISSLCHMHQLSSYGLRHNRLWYHAGVLRQMDLAIVRESIQKLNSGQLRHACFLRGINPTGMTNLEMLAWLKDWISVTQRLDAENLSLLLHCPILLAYNSPTNRRLIQ